MLFIKIIDATYTGYFPTTPYFLKAVVTEL